MESVISVKNLNKSFHVGGTDVAVLKNISFDVGKGDFLVIFGPSGCGKSTLLHTVLGLEVPNQGSVTFLGKNLYAAITDDDRSDFRKAHVGMVYQQPNWIKALTVLENVAFPLLLLGQPKETSQDKAREMLKTVAMEAWTDYLPTELSSGQQQKIALARALITDPEVIIADEPTGNLDYESGQELMKLLTNLNEAKGKTIVMVTHDLEYLNFAKTALKIFNGEVAGVYDQKSKLRLLTETKGKRCNVWKNNLSVTK